MDWDWRLESIFPKAQLRERWYWQQICDINREMEALAAPRRLVSATMDPIDLDRFRDQTQELALTNFVIDPKDLGSEFYHRVPESFYGYLWGQPSSLARTEPRWSFNFLANRCTMHRQLWAYLLIRQGWFDLGLINFGVNQRGHTGPRLSNLERFEKNFQDHLSNFGEEHAWLSRHVPYCNFPATQDLESVIMDSKFSIVIETVVGSGPIGPGTEKTFRCLKFPRPWIAFTIPGAIQHLRDLGFDVLDDVVDHAYDLEHDPISRQNRLLELIPHLMQLDFTDALFARLERAARENNSLLDHYDQRFFPDMTQCLHEARQRCLEL